MLFKKLTPDMEFSWIKIYCHDLVWLWSNDENFLSKNRLSSWELFHWIQQVYICESREGRRAVLVTNPRGSELVAFY